MGTNLDRTKKAIGVEGIDNKDRHEMFKKFQSAGGKIIKEVDDPTNPKNKDKSSGKDSGKNDSKGKVDFMKESANAKKKDTQVTYALSDSEMGNFLNRLIIKFKCWAGNITPFGSSVLLPKFLSEINLELRAALMEFRIVSNELLSNPEYSPKIVKTLDKMNPIFVEIIGRAGKIFDSVELAEILDDYSSNPDAHVPVKRAAPPIYSLFRKLYYLYPFQATFKKAVVIAYETLQVLEKRPALIYSAKKKKAVSEISTVFEKIFDKLYLAVIRNEAKNIPMVSLYMENILNIMDSERLGKRKAGEDLPPAPGEAQSEENEEESEEQTEENSETAQEMSPELSLGFKLMAETPVEALRKKHDPRNELAEFPDADKCLLTYLFFKEFDHEYSIVMTTKKIIIQSTTVNGNKVDNKAKLLGIYELSRNCMDQFKIYVDQAKEYFKAKLNPGSNYIEHSKKLTQLEQKRGQQSRNARATIREYIEKATDAFELLLTDMRGERQIVGNMDEILTFDSVDSKKKMNRKAVKQCIMEAYSYSLAFYTRLSEGPHGDLFGGVIELTPEQMQNIYGRAVVDNTSQSTVKPDDETSPLAT